MLEIGEIKRISRYKENGAHNGHRQQVWHACVVCGKERWVYLRKGIPTSLRCRSCGNKQKPSKPMEKHPRWKGGRTTLKAGYIVIRLQSDDFFYPMATKKGLVFEHRLIVAKVLGRCLHSWEIVHHKGAKYPKGSKDDKQDNRYPENLQLVSDDRHRQITILENKIKHLGQRIIILEAENIALQENATYYKKMWLQEDG